MSNVEAPRSFEMNILSAADFMKTVSEGCWHPVWMQRNRQTGEYKVQLVKSSETTLTASEDGRIVQQAPGYIVSYEVIEGLRLTLFDQIKETVTGSKLDNVRRTLREIEECVTRQNKPTKHYPKGPHWPAIKTNNAVCSPILTI